MPIKKLEQELNVSSVNPLPDGGYSYVYSFNGTDTTYFIPPAGFHPTKATDAQLQEYGFQPRPTDPEGLAMWNDVMKDYKTTPIPKIIAMLDTQTDGNESSGAYNASEAQSTNWSGVQNFRTSSSQPAFTEVQANFYQPAMKSDSVPGSSESTWVGLGGDGAYDNSPYGLIQAGTSWYNGVYNGWWELWYQGCATGQTNISFIVRPGDNIHVYVGYNTGTKATGVQIIDQTNGDFSTFSKNVGTIDGQYFQGNTAEFIDERQSLKDSNGNWYYSPLADYYCVSWTNCQSYQQGVGWGGAGHLTFRYLTMYDINYRQRLSHPDPMSDNYSFKDYFFAHG